MDTIVNLGSLGSLGIGPDETAKELFRRKNGRLEMNAQSWSVRSEPEAAHSNFVSPLHAC